MASFNELSPQAQINVERISAGRPPEDFGGDTQRFHNEAIDFINSNPALRKQVEGGVPTGLSEERRQSFRPSSQGESTQALGRIARSKDFNTPARTGQSPRIVKEEKATPIGFNTVGRFLGNTPQELIRKSSVQNNLDQEGFRLGLSEKEKQQPTSKVIKERFKEVGVVTLEKIGQANQKVSQKVIQPATSRIGQASEKIGGPANLQEASINIKTSTIQLENLGVPKSVTKTGEFISNFGIGATKEVINKPVTNIGLIAIGGGLGAGVKAVGLGAKTVGVGGLARVGGQTIKGLAIGGAVGLQTVETIQQPNNQIRAESLGGTFVQAVSFGAGFKGGAKTSQFFGEKIKVVSPTRQVRTPTFKETTAIINQGGESKRLSSFVIKQEVSPPIKTEITTRFRHSINAQPLSSSIKPPKVTTIRTLKPSEIGKDFLVTIQRQGSKKPTLATISGKSKQIELGDVGKTSKVGDFVSKNLGRATGTGDVLVQRQGERITAIAIKQRQLAKISTFGSKNNKGFNLDFDPKKFGRQTTRTAGLSKSKTIAENEQVRVIRSTISFKDVTKRFPRSTGKPKLLRGTTFELKQPFNFEGGTLGKTKIKTTSPKSKIQTPTLEPQLETLPKPLVKTPPTPQTTITSTQSSFVPAKTKTVTAVSSTRFSQSEQTRTNPILSVSRSSAVSQEQSSTTKQKQNLAFTPAFKIKSATSQRTGQRSIQRQATKQKQGLKQGLKTSQLQRQLARSGLVVPPARFGTPKTPTETLLPFKLPKLRKKKKKKGGTFTVQVRREGKFGTIAKTSDLQKAINIGTSRVSKTLGATFRIKGTKNLKGVRTPQGFRLPKSSSKIKGPLTFIEKRQFRLSKFGEVSEIQQSRRRLRK